MTSVGKDINELEAMKAEEVFAIFDKEFKTLLLDSENKERSRSTIETEMAGLGYPKEILSEMDEGTLLRRFEAKIGLLARKAKQSRDEYDPGYKLVYIYQPSGTPDAYVIPIQGNGLWDIIKGYIALEPDLSTVKGVSFYEHKETPGLGARITETWFKDNFKGKKVLDESGKMVSITVAKGPAVNDHQVDGISGATLTGKGVTHFLKKDLARYESYFQTIRAQ
jgi:Na+-transporting NADH:ubiquinone oxidoreductase subunit C